jgi:hypothetical protein
LLGLILTTTQKESLISMWEVQDASWAVANAAKGWLGTKFPCPAVLESPIPRNLWWAAFKASWRQAGAATCRQVSNWGTSSDYTVRCCYDSSNIYLPHWPSRIGVVPAKSSQWYTLEEEQLEEIACGSSTSSFTCEAFQRRRPANIPTNNVFDFGVTLWLMPRPFGGGWGDPHCQSIDGVAFECNFRGEANWVTCGNWSVHAVAELVSDGGKATTISKFAVRYWNETLVARLINVSSMADPDTGLVPNPTTSLSTTMLSRTTRRARTSAWMVSTMSLLSRTLTATS